MIIQKKRTVKNTLVANASTAFLYISKFLCLKIVPNDTVWKRLCQTGTHFFFIPITMFWQCEVPKIMLSDKNTLWLYTKNAVLAIWNFQNPWILPAKLSSKGWIILSLLITSVVPVLSQCVWSVCVYMYSLNRLTISRLQASCPFLSSGLLRSWDHICSTSLAGSSHRCESRGAFGIRGGRANG